MTGGRRSVAPVSRIDSVLRPPPHGPRMGLLEDKRRARSFYRFLAPVYDRINPFVWTTEMREDALDRFAPAPDDRVLDVGCGTGFATEALIERAGEVHGLDQSPDQLTRAFDRLGKHDPVSFVLGDAERLPYGENAFDAVWSSGSIEYWPDPVAALREFRRVTRPGGRVLVVGPEAPESAVVRRLADAIMLFYDESEADRLFAAAGFEAFDHEVLQARPAAPRALVTLAEVPA